MSERASKRENEKINCFLAGHCSRPPLPRPKHTHRPWLALVCVWSTGGQRRQSANMRERCKSNARRINKTPSLCARPQPSHCSSSNAATITSLRTACRFSLELDHSPPYRMASERVANYWPRKPNKNPFALGSVWLELVARLDGHDQTCPREKSSWPNG